ncbi:MAG: glycosyltransferase family 2 protein [Gemmatimonadales bacterium]|nr:MAG: glycosyltransferase family 2 protein [Gemmatimonadales bacterium]
MSEIARSAPESGSTLPDELRWNFAVVIPAYNEAPVIPDLIRELRTAFREHGLDGEVLLVDDGSTDGTADLARELAADWPGFRVLRHGRNLGKTEAMVTAAQATDRAVLVLFDADLQHSPHEIPRFLEAMGQGWDMVCGRKVGHYDKRAVSSVYNRLSRRLFDVPASDLNSMKAFRASILQEIPLRHDWHRFFVVLAADRGHTLTELDIELHPRRAGESKYQGLWRVVVGVMDLLSVWFLLAFSRKPLLLFGTAGVGLAGTGVLVGLVAVYLRVFHGVGFRPLLTLVLLLVTVGVTLFGFGLLAEMVAQLRQEVDQLRRRLREGR